MFLDKQEYKEYLESDIWQKRKEDYRKNHEYKCSKCNAKTNLHIHHLRYTFAGKEEDKDLQYLCWRCHGKEHNTTFSKPRKKIKYKDSFETNVLRKHYSLEFDRE